MKLKQIPAAILLIACCIYIHSDTCQADVSTLQDLLNGGSLTNQNTVYSNFGLLNDIGTNSIDPSQISIETLDDSDGFTLLSNGTLSLNAGNDSIIFQLGFDAETSGQAWNSTGVDLSLGNANITGSGLVDIFNSISDANAAVLAETNAFLDPGFGINVLSDSSLLSDSQTEVSFVSSFSLFADSASATSIDSYQITLSVPEPSSAIALTLLAVCSIIRRKR